MSTETSPSANDTVCAIATPPGLGGVGIIRISGPAVKDIAKAICGRLPQPRKATFLEFRDAREEAIDNGLALYFPAPNSFTGEDVLELQGHGGPVVLQMVLQRVMDLGGRQARPGEFSERAFLNNKLDLAQAEAIADLVTSGTEAAARAAQHSLSGVFSGKVSELQTLLTHMRVFVEAAIDFPEEEIDFLAESDVLERLQATRKSLGELLIQAREGRVLRDGVVLAIAGRPNAGKSSLLNALSGQDSAIVTELPGTTRDVLREWIDMDGIPVHIADTAGIRETADRIEREGVKRARGAVEQAEIVLLVIDVTASMEPQLALLQEIPGNTKVLIVLNKTDLLASGQDSVAALRKQQPSIHCVAISALHGDGLEDLKHQISKTLGVTEQSEGVFSARQRHIDALGRAASHLELAEQRLTKDNAGELLAEELRLTQQALGEITGEMLPDDLLGEIFSSFCIGK